MASKEIVSAQTGVMEPALSGEVAVMVPDEPAGLVALAERLDLCVVAASTGGTSLWWRRDTCRRAADPRVLR